MIELYNSDFYYFQDFREHDQSYIRKQVQSVFKLMHQYRSHVMHFTVISYNQFCNCCGDTKTKMYVLWFPKLSKGVEQKIRKLLAYADDDNSVALYLCMTCKKWTIDCNDFSLE